MPAVPETLPAGYGACTWCGAANRLDTSGKFPGQCFHCGLTPNATTVQPRKRATPAGRTTTGTRTPAKPKAAATRALALEPVGRPLAGVDPGSRYTGVVVRDGDAVLHSSTLVRPKEITSGTEWALTVVAQVQQILKDFPARIPVAIEGISDPKGFQHGKQAAINPKDIIRAGIVLGALVQAYPTAIIVPPGNNGSRHASHYPPQLVGRRPADLPGAANGAGTRNHEQSAYDVAGKAAREAYPNFRKPVNFS
jgi:hypothetical protein